MNNQVERLLLHHLEGVKDELAGMREQAEKMQAERERTNFQLQVLADRLGALVDTLAHVRMSM